MTAVILGGLIRSRIAKPAASTAAPSAIGRRTPSAGGTLGDRIGALPALRLALAVDLVAISLLPFAGSKLTFAAFAVLHGLAIGTEVAVVPVIALAILGTQRVATLSGSLQLGATVAMGLAPVVPGIIFDRTESYAGALAFWGVVMGAGIVVALALRVPPGAVAAVAPPPAGAHTRPDAV